MHKSYWTNNTAKRYWSEYIWKEDYREKYLNEVELFAGYVNSIIAKDFREPPIIIELCCGCGDFTLKLLTVMKSFESYLCVDVNPKAIENLKKKINVTDDFYNKFNFLCAYAFDDGVFEDHSANLIVCSRALHHVPDIEGFFNGVHKVLKDEGLFVANIVLKEYEKAVLTMKYSFVASMLRLLYLGLHRLAGKGIWRSIFTKIGVLRTHNPLESELVEAITKSNLKIIYKHQDINNGYLRFALKKSSNPTLQPTLLTLSR